MDTNFQTSFIPKKPLAEERAPAAPHHTSIFAFIATLIFLGSLAGAGAAYFYKQSLTKTIATQQTELTEAQNAFEPSLITQLKVLDRRITDANDIINNHIVITPIFDALQTTTIKSIQFTHFTYTTPVNPGDPITVLMTGKARDYSSIALESDQLATNKDIHNSVFSNLTLDDTTGIVSFSLSFTVDPDLVMYTNHLSDFVTTQGAAVTNGDTVASAPVSSSDSTATSVFPQ